MSVLNARQMRSSSRLGIASSAAASCVLSSSTLLLAIGDGGIETGVEQGDELGDETRVGVERVLDVRLAEAEADLPQVLGVRPHDGDLARGEAGPQHEAVEAVALHVAVDERAERRLQLLASVRVEVDRRGHLDPDVVEEHLLVAGAERVRLLVERLEAQVVEEREQLRQRRRRTLAVHAEAPLTRRGVDLVAERRRELVGAGQQGGDVAHVAGRPLRRHRRAVRRGSVTAHAIEQIDAGLLTELTDQGGPHALGPRRRQLVDGPFEHGDVDPARRARTAHVDRDAGERARSHQRLEGALVRPLGPVSAGDGLGDSLWQLSREPVAREVDEHGGPGADRVGHLEHADELTLLQPDDVGDELSEPVWFELEDEIARQVLQHRAGGPAGMGVHARLGEVEDAAGVGADAGDVEHADPVGVGRQQPDESPLGCVVGADDHDGLALRPEHGCAGVAAGDDDGPVTGHRRRVGPIELADLAELAPPPQGERAVGGPVVVGGAEEHELAVGEPRQERVDRAQLLHPRPHRREVIHDEADVLDRADDLVLAPCAPWPRRCGRSRSASTPRPTRRRHRRRRGCRRHGARR